jgi:DNA-binding Xre family transcriptional regulator
MQESYGTCGNRATTAPQTHRGSAIKLRDRGVVLSTAQVYRLVADKPERLSMRILVALCDILDCSPADLIDPYVEAAARKKVAGESKVIDLNPDFRPKRARIVDDE